MRQSGAYDRTIFDSLNHLRSLIEDLSCVAQWTREHFPKKDGQLVGRRVCAVDRAWVEGNAACSRKYKAGLRLCGVHARGHTRVQGFRFYLKCLVWHRTHSLPADTSRPVSSNTACAVKRDVGRRTGVFCFQTLWSRSTPGPDTDGRLQ